MGYVLQVARCKFRVAIGRGRAPICYLSSVICHFIRALGENEYGFTYGISSTWTIRSSRFGS
jgi:hypothetical protein